MARVCVFDVNETLLDLSALDERFERHFGDASARAEWFGQFQQSWLTATVVGLYRDFATIAGTALTMVAALRGVELTDEATQDILSGMRELPPHPEVRDALERMRDSGLRLAALTNSTGQVAETQLANAGLRDLFDKALSADDAGRLKPAPEPYRMAADSLGVEVSQVRLVAAHSWDIAGAMRVGCAGAFVGRPGKVLDPLFERPDVVGSDLLEVAERIIAAENP
jgi:2-haloacid dehalogenase